MHLPNRYVLQPSSFSTLNCDASLNTVFSKMIVMLQCFDITQIIA